jgi:hypothetical protein
MNETSRKRRPSLTSPIRISKRQRQIPDDQTAASTTTLKIESALLRLLREVRDQIYSLAIGTDTLTIRHDDLILEGVNSRYGKLNGKAEGLEGLPSWLRTCKQICSEALQVVGQTYTFELQSDRRQRLAARDRKLRSLGPRPRAPPNLLAINREVLRLIVISPRFRSDKPNGIKIIERIRSIEQTNSLLVLLKQLQVQDACLELDWAGVRWRLGCRRSRRVCRRVEQQRAGWQVPQGQSAPR